MPPPFAAAFAPGVAGCRWAGPPVAFDCAVAGFEPVLTALGEALAGFAECGGEPNIRVTSESEQTAATAGFAQ